MPRASASRSTAGSSVARTPSASAHASSSRARIHPSASNATNAASTSAADGPPTITSAIRSDQLLQPDRDALWDAQLDDLIDRRLSDRGQAAERAQQQALAGRADALHRVERRRQRLARARLAVVRD